LFSFDRGAVARPEEIEAHLLAGCTECERAISFSRSLDDDLEDADVWERTVGSATLASLRKREAEIAKEDEDAATLLDPLLTKPAAAARIDWRQKRFRFGGVVRYLCNRAHAICESKPLDALIFADGAVAVAELLDEASYVAGGVHELRGVASTGRANALRLLGHFDDAHHALNKAEQAFGRLKGAALGITVVHYVRATVFFEQQRYDEADVFATRAEKASAHLGSDDGRIKALFLRATIAYERGQIRDAIAVFHEILAWGEALESAYWIAHGTLALGNCYLDTHDVAAAQEYFARALKVFGDLHVEADRAKTEWGIARSLLQIGKPAEAVRRLLDVSSTLEEYGLITDAALAALDAADGLVVLGRVTEVVPLAERLFAVFKTAGMLTGALTALAYLRESAGDGELTRSAVAHVRTFVARVDRQPHLAFEPPTSPFY
jgi:tetratricopeptide (TPR) repeat protein